MRETETVEQESLKESKESGGRDRGQEEEPRERPEALPSRERPEEEC